MWNWLVGLRTWKWTTNVGSSRKKPKASNSTRRDDPILPTSIPPPSPAVIVAEDEPSVWRDETSQRPRTRTSQVPRNNRTALARPPSNTVEQPSGPTATNNYRLPFDILALVFESFAEMEGPDSPLETILAVCRFWRDSALEHRVLWTTFRLSISTSWQVSYWKKRFLRRADAGSLLDITLKLSNTTSPKPKLPAGTFDYASYERLRHHNPAHTSLAILKVISGGRGARALQWRSLTLDLHDLENLTPQDYALVNDFLLLRTPNLESVKLYGVMTGPRVTWRPIFPYALRLQTAVFHSCQLMNLMDTTNLRSLTWYSTNEFASTDMRSQHTIHALRSAQKITFLEIGLDWPYWDTSIVFQRVKTLRMVGTVNPEFVIMIQVPSLRHLALGIDGDWKFGYIKDCKGIPCAQVESLEIFYVPPNANPADVELSVSHEGIVQRMKLLLTQMENLRVLSWEESMVTQPDLLMSILKVFVGGSVEIDTVSRPGHLVRYSA